MHTALVHWVPPEEIGRERLPSVLQMMALSRFPEDGANWPDGSWSIELTFEQPPMEQMSKISEARVRFAFDGAPEQRLRRGARFGLYQGPTKIADVDVLD